MSDHESYEDFSARIDRKVRTLQLATMGGWLFALGVAGTWAAQGAISWNWVWALGVAPLVLVLTGALAIALVVESLGVFGLLAGLLLLLWPWRGR